MDEIIPSSLGNAKEGPTQDDFVFIGGMEMTVADFVSIWNGDEILPKLSEREINVARRVREPTPNVHDDPWNDGLDSLWLFRPSRKHGLTKREECGLQKRKFRDIKGLIGRFHSEGQSLGVLDMDRVLAVLSSGGVRFNDVTQFVARYAEPDASEAMVVREAAHESHEIDGIPHVETRYVSDASAAPLASLPEDAKEALQKYFGVNKKALSLIPIIILERVLAGQELTDDDLCELTNIRNIGSVRVIYILQKTREALVMAGVLAMSSLMFTGRDIELIDFLFKAGMITMAVGSVAHFVPLSSFKPRVKLASSVGRYGAIEGGLRKVLARLCESPAGRVRAMLVQELVKETYEPSANGNIPRLKAFAALLDTNKDIEDQFNTMYLSMDRPLDQFAGILEAIDDFESVHAELEEAPSQPRLEAGDAKKS